MKIKNKKVHMSVCTLNYPQFCRMQLAIRRQPNIVTKYTCHPASDFVNGGFWEVISGSCGNFDNLVWVNLIRNNSIACESKIKCSITQIFTIPTTTQNHLQKTSIDEACHSP